MIEYVTRRDGHVAAYGPESDSSMPGSWRATEWSAHPRSSAGAVHLRDLCGDATRAELATCLDAWAAEVAAAEVEDT